jgi:hypothetical protein
MTRVARIAAGAVAVGFAMLPLTPAGAIPIGTTPIGTTSIAQSPAPSSGVPDVAETWYTTLPIPKCASIPLCPQLGSIVSKLLSLAPLNSIRVGNILGQESERAYVLPDLSAVHKGDDAHGQMVLPIDTSPTAGTIAPQTAKIEACAATQRFADAPSGGTGALPKTDCFVSSPLKYNAKLKAFTLDLTPFLRGWEIGRPRDGIALIPSPSAADKSLSSTWLVAFAAHKTATPSTRIHSLITTGAAVNSGMPPSTSTSPSPTPTSPTSVAPVPGLSLPGTTVEVPPAGAPEIAPQTEVAYPITVGRGYRYPVVFIVPLLMLLGAVFFARVFTSDATPRRHQS